MLLQGESSRGSIANFVDFFFFFLSGEQVTSGNQRGANCQTLPVNKVIFVEVQKPRGNVTRHSLQEKRVGGLGVGLSTAVQVALRIALRQEGTGCCGC